MPANSSVLTLGLRASRHQMRQGLSQDRDFFADNLWAAAALGKSLLSYRRCGKSPGLAKSAIRRIKKKVSHLPIRLGFQTDRHSAPFCLALASPTWLSLWLSPFSYAS